MFRALLVLVVFIFPATAQAFTGLDLLRACKFMLSPETIASPVDAMNAGQCAGFVNGIHDAVKVTESIVGRESALFCAPTLQTEQVVRLSVKYLTDNPDVLHQPARVGVIVALRKAFPCK